MLLPKHRLSFLPLAPCPVKSIPSFKTWTECHFLHKNLQIPADRISFFLFSPSLKLSLPLALDRYFMSSTKKVPQSRIFQTTWNRVTGAPLKKQNHNRNPTAAESWEVELRALQAKSKVPQYSPRWSQSPRSCRTGPWSQSDWELYSSYVSVKRQFSEIPKTDSGIDRKEEKKTLKILLNSFNEGTRQML